jgi:hypothetical protein
VNKDAEERLLAMRRNMEEFRHQVISILIFAAIPGTLRTSQC